LAEAEGDFVANAIMPEPPWRFLDKFSLSQFKVNAFVTSKFFELFDGDMSSGSVLGYS
jgi:hypothetical protein